MEYSFWKLIALIGIVILLMFSLITYTNSLSEEVLSEFCEGYERLYSGHNRYFCNEVEFVCTNGFWKYERCFYLQDSKGVEENVN